MLDRSALFLHRLVDECPQITNPYLDWRYLAPFWRNGQKKSENREISANFDSPKNFLGAAKILKWCTSVQHELRDPN